MSNLTQLQPTEPVAKSTGILAFRSRRENQVLTQIAQPPAPFNVDAYPKLDVDEYSGKSGDIRYQELCVALNEKTIECFGGNTSCSWFVDEDTVLRAWEMTLYDRSKPMLMTTNPDGQFIGVAGTYSSTLLEMYNVNWGDFIDPQRLRDAIQEYIDHVKIDPKIKEETVNKIHKTVNTFQYSTFIQRVHTYRGVDRIEYEKDMFFDTPSIRIVGATATISLPHKKYKASQNAVAACKQMGIEKVLAYAQDYVAFKPTFQKILDVMVWHAFATYRKDSYMYYNAITGAGKGFDQGWGERSGIMYKVTADEYKRILEQQPAGVDASKLRNSLALAIDEARTITDADKAAATHLTINVKHGPQTNVRIGLKIYYCHNPIDSLTASGLDAEFVDRFVTVPRFNKKLGEHPLFVENKHEYTHAVEWYATRYVNEYIEQLKEMGPKEAAEFSNAKLDEFLAEHNLADVVGKTSDDLEGVARQVLREIMRAAATSYEKPRGALSSVEVYYDAADKKEKVVVVDVQNLKAIIDQVIDEVLGKSLRVKYRRNQAAILDMLTPRNNGARMGQTGKGKNLYRDDGSRIKRRGVHLPLGVELEDLAECWDVSGRRAERTAQDDAGEENDA
jgi:hypothetical protein